jgi:hypothetical protein
MHQALHPKTPSFKQRPSGPFITTCRQMKTPRPTTNLFTVTPNIDTETLLANAAENLASASQMAATLAFDVEEPHRAIVLGIQQLIELSELLVDRAQDQVAPASGKPTA